MSSMWSLMICFSLSQERTCKMLTTWRILYSRLCHQIRFHLASHLLNLTAMFDQVDNLSKLLVLSYQFWTKEETVLKQQIVKSTPVSSRTLPWQTRQEMHPNTVTSCLWKTANSQPETSTTNSVIATTMTSSKMLITSRFRIWMMNQKKARKKLSGIISNILNLATFKRTILWSKDYWVQVQIREWINDQVMLKRQIKMIYKNNES